MKSKWMRSLMPSDLSMSTTLPRLVRWINLGDGVIVELVGGRPTWCTAGSTCPARRRAGWPRPW
eukprot:scaffold23058_cov68-Phaeocystis_antarctica.AAC.1